MPKAATYMLCWSDERKGYELYDRNRSEYLLRGDDGASLLAWLEHHGSFAFHGQAGRINLLKEARKGSSVSYWYAYRRQGKNTAKRYVGRSEELTVARLEAIATSLANPVAIERPSAPTLPATPESPRVTLLAPKLQLPRLSASLVVRPRLFALLDSGSEGRLTLVSAPAGFGKTTLVRQWIAQRAENTESGSVAWVSLDEGDNDPMRFWRYVIAACTPFSAGGGQSALALLPTTLQPPFEPLPYEMILAPFLNDLAQCVESSTLVLEDYHVITELDIHAAMAFFLDHLPATVHVVLLTRSEPPLPLARLRARGDLCEIQASDLRFSLGETQRFLSQAIVTPIASEAVAQLDSQLEGWAAGLRLLTLALQGRASPEEATRVVTTFAGSHRPVLEYFIGEVLNAQPAHIQHFLLHTSVLHQLTGSLCDAAMGDGSSASQHSSLAILESLVRANLFVESLDGNGEWYRYHALFADAMRFEARRRLGDDILRAVSARASIWYEQQESLADAVEAALQAHEPERVAMLIERIVGNQQFIFASQLFSAAHESHTLRRWLEQLPVSVLAHHPALCIGYAVTLVLALIMGSSPRPRRALVDEMLQLAEQGFHAVGTSSRVGEVYAFRAILEKQAGHIDDSVSWARQALALLPAEEMAWRGASLSSMGGGEQFAGRLATAAKLFNEAHTISKAVSNWGFARATRGMLGSIYVEQGDLHHAATLMRQNLHEGREMADRDDIAHAQVGLMDLSYDWNQLAVAEEQAREVYDIGVQIDDEGFQVQAITMLSRIDHARGETTSAQRRIAELIHQTQPHRSMRLRWYYDAACSLQARLYLAAGDLAAAARWAERRNDQAVELPYLQRAREQLIVARLLIAQEEVDKAIALLDDLLTTAQQAGQTRYAWETSIVLALAYAQNGQTSNAQRHLRWLLPQAARAELVRSFLDEGEPMAALLRATLPTLREQPLLIYTRMVLGAFDAAHALGDATIVPQPLLEPLSIQEQRVLRLLIAGRSNPEIAQQLIVSVNTIKAHLKNIYRKLNVNNRMEASMAARELRLAE